MNIKKYIPNLFTLGNLFSGLIALIFVFQGNFKEAAFFTIIGIVLDFFDGFLARVLNVQGELGKQLDSLADMITSGVVPGFIMFSLIFNSSYIDNDKVFIDIGINSPISSNDYPMIWLAYFGLILTLSAAYRLAKFNIDIRQSESFIGLPTPAMSLFVVSLPLIQMHTDIEFVKNIISNNYFLIGVTLILSILMNTNLPLFSFKFKNYGVKENTIKYFLIVASGFLLITVQYLAIPIIIILYIILSMIQNAIQKGKTP